MEEGSTLSRLWWKTLSYSLVFWRETWDDNVPVSEVSKFEIFQRWLDVVELAMTNGIQFGFCHWTWNLDKQIQYFSLQFVVQKNELNNAHNTVLNGTWTFITWWKHPTVWLVHVVNDLQMLIYTPLHLSLDHSPCPWSFSLHCDLGCFLKCRRKMLGFKGPSQPSQPPHCFFLYSSNLLINV